MQGRGTRAGASFLQGGKPGNPRGRVDEASSYGTTPLSSMPPSATHSPSLLPATTGAVPDDGMDLLRSVSPPVDNGFDGPGEEAAARGPTPPLTLSIAGDSITDGVDEPAPVDMDARAKSSAVAEAIVASASRKSVGAGRAIDTRPVALRGDRTTGVSRSPTRSDRITRPDPQPVAAAGAGGLSPEDVARMHRSGKGTFETTSMRVVRGPLAVRLVPATTKGIHPRLGAVVAEVDADFAADLPMQQSDVIVRVYGASVRDWHFSSILRMFREAAGTISAEAPVDIEVARLQRRRRGWIEDPASREGSPSRSRAGSDEADGGISGTAGKDGAHEGADAPEQAYRSPTGRQDARYSEPGRA